MRVKLLTQWYDPEPGPAALPGVLARGLSARGHEVQVVTGFPNYSTGKAAPGYAVRPRLDERLGDVAVRRVAVYADHSASRIWRFANYASFGASAVGFGLGAQRGLDALWVNYSPITVAWPMWVARYGLRVPSVVHVLDLWPDTLRAAGFAGEGPAYQAAVRPLHAWCRSMYRAATSVEYISPGVGTVLQQRGVPAAKLHYVPMWADEAVFYPSHDDLRGELGLDEQQIVLLYAGALGDAQSLQSLIDACATITDPRFVALIAGSGVAEDSLRERARRAGVHNVRFIRRWPQARMTELIATADLSYVSLRSHALSAVTMPSKVQAGLASGRPLVIAADCDVAKVGEESGAAFSARTDDPADIARAISLACSAGRQALAERGRRRRQYYGCTFSVGPGGTKIEELLRDAAARTVAA